MRNSDPDQEPPHERSPLCSLYDVQYISPVALSQGSCIPAKASSREIPRSDSVVGDGLKLR